MTNLTKVERRNAMRIFIVILSMLVLASANPAIAGPDYISGVITNYTAIAGGLLIMFDSGIPDNCAGTPYNWIIIAETDKTMLAMALMRISQDNMQAAVYSNGQRYLGFCRAIQFNPQDY
jgi:hypothetical protein